MYPEVWLKLRFSLNRAKRAIYKAKNAAIRPHAASFRLASAEGQLQSDKQKIICREAMLVLKWATSLKTGK
jgi:hypothetical protein